MPYIDTTRSRISLQEAFGGRAELPSTGGSERSRNLAALRRLCWTELGRPLSVDKPAEALNAVAAASVSPDSAFHVCNFRAAASECSPDSRSANRIYQIGLDGCQPATVDLALSAGLGLRWRLSSGHPAAINHWQLGRFEGQEDETQPSQPGMRYVAVADLEAAMAPLIDVDAVEQDLYALMRTLSTFPIEGTVLSTIPGDWHEQSAFHALALDAYSPSGPPQKRLRHLVSLRLMLQTGGLKIVDIQARRSPQDVEGAERDLVQSAENLSRHLKLFMAGT